MITDEEEEGKRARETSLTPSPPKKEIVSKW